VYLHFFRFELELNSNDVQLLLTLKGTEMQMHPQPASKTAGNYDIVDDLTLDLSLLKGQLLPVVNQCILCVL